MNRKNYVLDKQLFNQKPWPLFFLFPMSSTSNQIDSSTMDGNLRRQHKNSTLSALLTLQVSTVLGVRLSY